jgi:hypothetical protein
MWRPNASQRTGVSGTAGWRLRDLLGSVSVGTSAEVGGWVAVGLLAVLAVGLTSVALLLAKPAASPAVVASLVSGASPTQGPPAVGDAADAFPSPSSNWNLNHAQARAWNQSLPFSGDPIQPAPPLIVPATDIESYGRALDCLTAAIYYEAASEPSEGQAAVAQVVLNRTRHPAYPGTVCGVVFQGSERVTGCQFSFTCDGAMLRVPSRTGWARARSIAAEALNGEVMAAVGMSTHYHADFSAPYWASRLSKTVQIGRHIFYRWRGAWGLQSAFDRTPVGSEPIVPRMAGLTTIAPAKPSPSHFDTEATPIALHDPQPGLAPPPAGLPPPPPPQVVAARTAPDDGVALVPLPAGSPSGSHRDAPIMADPLRSPADPPSRQRQRIAAPSAW